MFSMVQFEYFSSLKIYFLTANSENIVQYDFYPQKYQSLDKTEWNLLVLIAFFGEK